MMDLTGRLIVCRGCGAHLPGRSREELLAHQKTGTCYLCGRPLPAPEAPKLSRFATPEDRLRQHIAPVVTR